MNQVRTVLLVQFVSSFVGGVLGIAVPLMMEHRKVDIVMIGLVFASMPLIMQFGRMFFATFSDFLGRKLFFLASGVLGVVSSLIYYLANSPLHFLLGKVAEGTKEGALWAVNRAFLLETSDGRWKALVYLRTAAYLAYAVGSFSAGFLIVSFLFEGTMLFCASIGVLVFLLSLLIVSARKEQFDRTKALNLLDIRKKSRRFKVFLFLFLMMGLSFGFREGFILPLFLDSKGFDAEAIGLIFGLQILLAGLFSYVFSRTTRMRQLILVSGALYSVTFLMLGYLDHVLAGVVMVGYGVVEGMASIGQEGALAKICDKESYGTDIGLTMMGLHVGEALSLALSGYLIALWGFAVPFVLSASLYVFFYVGSYFVLKE